VAVVQGNVSRNLSATLQADGGYARDRAVGFGPDTGPAAVPPAPFSFFFEREYRPWRLSASLVLALTSGVKLEAGYEHRSTVFYTSDMLHATVGGRF
jgi:hypothetical protein